MIRHPLPRLHALLFLLALACGGTSDAERERFVGHWEGRLEGGGEDARLVLHVQESGRRLVATLDSPDQHMRAFPIGTVAVSDTAMQFAVDALNARFEGAFDAAAGTMSGTWKQGVVSLPLTFRRVDSLFARPLPYRYEIPESLSDGWAVAGLEDVGLDAPRFAMLGEDIRGGVFSDFASLLVVRDGRLVFEEYDSEYYGRDYLHPVASVTKSVTSALVGIALDKGFLVSLDESVYSFFPDYERGDDWSDVKNDITLAHLLTMRTGWNCNNLDRATPGHPDKMQRAGDRIDFVLDLPMASDPGKTFSYCEGNAVVAGEIIRMATGQSGDAFAQDYLFEPLGIERVAWYVTSRGTAAMGSGLRIRSRDLAKFGQLFLDGGVWRDTRIVSRVWVGLSTREHVATRTLGAVGYGYFWWRDTFGVGDQEVDAYVAVGSGGNKLIVVPDERLVVVVTQTATDEVAAFARIDHMMNRYILPAARRPSGPLYGEKE